MPAILTMVAPQNWGGDSPTFEGHNSDDDGRAETDVLPLFMFMFIISSSDPTPYVCCYAAHNVYQSLDLAIIRPGDRYTFWHILCLKFHFRDLTE